MKQTATVTIDNRTVQVGEERNLLELARKAGIDIPTFCYHSELSVYGACRLCLVDIEGQGIVTSCSVTPADGMVVRTRTEEIREMRRIALELILANHDQRCPTCPKSTSCRLQDLTRRMGIREVRFRPTHQPKPLDTSSPSLVRDPNKCILCGDCVRACREIQGIGAIDFVGRGANVEVLSAFGKDLAQVECVGCGQCAAVCPTGALTPAQQVDDVWKALDDPIKTVVAQIAPAVRVALGELFGHKPGEATMGQTVAALKALGFDYVYDTCFAADLTVIEEAEEFLARKAAGENLPVLTSCCPAWVTFAEQNFPELLGNLSSCRSPQQMLGSLVKKILPETTGAVRGDVVVVSIMPCTAKKAEARRPEFATDGVGDVDFVLTTQELGRMIEQAGLDFNELQPASLDMPLGFKTGAGMIFGASGGVTEAVLRYAAEKLSGVSLERADFEEVRGSDGLRELTLDVAGTTLRLAVVQGLAQARDLAEKVRRGEAAYDLVEVMSCPGGCIGGAGQPVSHMAAAARQARTRSVYDVDKQLQLHKAQDNHMVAELYEKRLGQVGGPAAHELLHTHYRSRRRLFETGLELGSGEGPVRVRVCVGTNCYVRAGQDLLRRLVHEVEQRGLAGSVDVEATFCLERCGSGPVVTVDDEIIQSATFEAVWQVVVGRVAALGAAG